MRFTVAALLRWGLPDGARLRTPRGGGL